MSQERQGNQGRSMAASLGAGQPPMPTAPYPPMLSSRYPSAHVTTMRSSMTSSPQYSSSTTSGGGHLNHRQSGGEINEKSKEMMTAPAGSGQGMSSMVDPTTTTRRPPTTSGGVLTPDHHHPSNNNSSNKGMGSSGRHYTARIQFCNSNMVACINCQPPPSSSASMISDQVGWGLTNNTATTTPQDIFMAPTPPRVNRKKLGPILLDLRQIVPQFYHHHPEIPTAAATTTESSSNNLFTTKTVSLSRGNPSLGTSVSSTCLDVSSILPASTYGAAAINPNKPPPCATGLTTGALCIHTFSPDEVALEEQPQQQQYASYTSSIEYFHTPRHHRQATAVSWRRHNSRHVAIGLVSSAMANMNSGAPTHHAMNMNMNLPAAINARRGPANPAGAPRGGGGGGSGGGGDREFCCFLWDIEHQHQSTAAASANTGSSSSSAAKRTNSSPLFKLSHNAGVASLAWLLEGGQTLAVGGQQRNIQLYDLRVSGTSSATPPISAFGHNFGVHGIQVDPFRPHQFATFCRQAGEPVKIWDARRMDAAISEIKVNPSSSGASQTASRSGGGGSSKAADNAESVSSIRWSSREAGLLSVSVGSVVLDYDTSSRPVLSRVNRTTNGPILDMSLYPGGFVTNNEGGQEAMAVATRTQSLTKETPAASGVKLISELYPQRMLVILGDRTVQDMAKHTIAPLAVSRRDGRVVHALGQDLFMGSTGSGPSTMESLHSRPDEDISAIMMRRARCLHAARYSMDTASNIQVLAEEMPMDRLSPERDALLRLWTWIDRMEALCSSGSTPEELANMEDSGFWATKGFEDTGVWKLLEMGNEALKHPDTQLRSDSLACEIYDSPVRRAALTACGWTGRFDLSNVLAECESLGEYERSAALAVFHGSLGSAVDALQRGADAIHRHLGDDTCHNVPVSAPQYAESLQLVAMCVAGFGGIDSRSPSSSVWRRACESLLRRPDLNGKDLRTSRTAYLRALCTFLINITMGRGYDEVLEDEHLSLCDRVAFACRFLTRNELKTYLQRCVEACQESGNIEGLAITGIEKEGIKIIQSYVDQTADVQTAALVTSRVILPSDWTSERRVCAEFLDSYRTLLNTWQMWQSRAMFDVDRSDLLRKIKIRQADALVGGNVKTMNFQGRRMQSRGRQGMRQADPDIVPSVPAQLDARCTYCSASLGLKRLDNHANQWLSKMKPVLSCCPSCQKPLPRCAICLLSLGCLNPYMELTRERERSRPNFRASSSLQPPDDLSSLANLPFAEWFTWCMTCKHGGHAHHLVGWFANHDTCPVSGCDCRCQFDGIQKLNRPALTKPLQLVSPQQPYCTPATTTAAAAASTSLSTTKTATATASN